MDTTAPHPESPEHRTTWQRALSSKATALVLLVAAVLATYGNTLANGYVWDDFDIIVDNPETHSLHNLRTVLLSPDLTAPYYRPVARALFLVEYAVAGANPVVSHGVSLAFHLAAVVALYFLGRVLWRRSGPALATALLWAVHPMGSEAVALASVRTSVMAACFSLTSLLAFWRGLTTRKPLWIGLSGLLFLLAVGSKEQALMTLPMAGVLYWISPKLQGPRATPKAVLLHAAPYAAAVAGYLVARVHSLGGLLGNVPHVMGRSSAMGPHDIALAVGKYAALSAWPARLTITHDLQAGPQSVLIFGFLAAVALTAISVYRSTPARWFGVAWFWLMLLPTLQLIALPSAPFAERHGYLLLPGLLIIVVDWIAEALQRGPAKGAMSGAVAATALLAVALGLRTHLRNRDWHDNRTLFESALAVGPSALAHLNLGNEAMREGDLATAATHWREAVAIDPKDADALNQLGTLAARAGRFIEARDYFARALEAMPGHPVAAANLARLPSSVSRHRPPRLHATGSDD